jgi:hypothetical protein
MENPWNAVVWRQFGAAIDMLKNAIDACPDDVWGDRSRQPEFWYVAYHTLFFLDLCLTGPLEGFQPPPPYTLSELDPSGAMPDRVYTRDEMREYLRHCRARCRQTIEGMTEEQAAELITYPWVELGRAELLLYNLRHVQHHTGQLNLLLRQRTDDAPRWVKQALEHPSIGTVPA